MRSEICLLHTYYIQKTVNPLQINVFPLNGVQEAAGSNPVTRTMRSVLIGFDNPVMDTPHFLFLRSSYCDLGRGVA